MQEAVVLGTELSRLFTDQNLEDGGARYKIVVTDTAGNISEVHWDNEQAKWVSKEGVSREASERIAWSMNRG
jgi:hypothetical protein